MPAPSASTTSMAAWGRAWPDCWTIRTSCFEVEAVNADTHRLDAARGLLAPQLRLLWNATPDEELLAAADRGDLDTRKGLARQADRLLASPRIEAGVRAFFSDMLGFETFHDLQKEQSLYPKFSLQAQQDAQEQTLRTIVDLLVTNHGDYRDLFTTHRTFITRALGPIYNVPVTDVAGWQPYEFPQGDPRAGILTQLELRRLALPSRSQFTDIARQGRAPGELLLCRTRACAAQQCRFLGRRKYRQPEIPDSP